MDERPGNRVDGAVRGAVVQASTVHGGIHLHSPSTTPVPRQLPGTMRHFVGRREQLAELSRHLEQAGDSPGTVSLSTIEGMPGIGKSALAIEWAHQNAARFPDGQLYANLRGCSPSGAMDPGEALWGFLNAMGMPTDTPSLDLDAQAAFFRSLVAGKRVLVVLDDVRDCEQVAHLMPGTASCHVLITSRRRLTGLVARMGVRPVTLESLTHGESVTLLEQILGHARVAAEPDATRLLIELCTRLPLALTILAGRVSEDPTLPLRTLATRLGNARDRLGTLDTGDAGVNVTTVFSWSYEALDPPTARLFRLLSLHPGPDFSLIAAACAAGLTPSRTDQLITRLVRAHLLERRPHGRYGFHDLVRLYAQERAITEETITDRHASVFRVLDHYLHTGIAADAFLGSPWEPFPVDSPRPGAHLKTVSTPGQAMAWFTTEHAVLLGIFEQRENRMLDHHIWRLARTLVTYLDRQGHWRDFVTTQRAALAAAQRLGEHAAQATAHRQLARALIRQELHDEAHHHLHHALDRFTAVGDVAGQAHTHYALGYLNVRARNAPQALQHTSHALALARASGQEIWEAKAMNNIGWCYLEFDDYDSALPHSLRALDLFRELDADPDGQAHTLECLGTAYLGLGQPEEALHSYRQALVIREGLGNRYTQASTWRHIAEAHHITGENDAERTALQHALTILEHLGHADAHMIRTLLTNNGNQTG